MACACTAPWNIVVQALKHGYFDALPVEKQALSPSPLVHSGNA
jgi:hypothetical protein